MCVEEAELPTALSSKLTLRAQHVKEMWRLAYLTPFSEAERVRMEPNPGSWPSLT